MNLILVLLNGINKNNLTESSTLRLNKAIDISSPKHIFITSTAYTVNKKIYLENGLPLTEAYIAAQFLQKKGVSKKNILTEQFSHDTIGNAYLSKLIHIDVLKPNKLTVVTSQFHMDRVKLIFNWIYFELYESLELSIEYVTASNPNFTKTQEKAILDREVNSIKNLNRLRNDINNLNKFHYWFFHEHEAYSYFKKPKKVNSIIKSIY